MFACGRAPENVVVSVPIAAPVFPRTNFLSSVGTALRPRLAELSDITLMARSRNEEGFLSPERRDSPDQHAAGEKGVKITPSGGPWRTEHQDQRRGRSRRPAAADRAVRRSGLRQGRGRGADSTACHRPRRSWPMEATMLRLSPTWSRLRAAWPTFPPSGIESASATFVERFFCRSSTSSPLSHASALT